MSFHVLLSCCRCDFASAVACRAGAGMAQQGATLQNYNNELVKCIEDLREKREEVRVRNNPVKGHI